MELKAIIDPSLYVAVEPQDSLNYIKNGLTRYGAAVDLISMCEHTAK
jgi:hypothetical protein